MSRYWRTSLAVLASVSLALTAGMPLAKDIEKMSAISARDFDFPSFVARFENLHEEEIHSSFTRLRALRGVNDSEPCTWLWERDTRDYVASALAEQCWPYRLLVAVSGLEPGGKSATFDLGDGYMWGFDSSQLVGGSLGESGSFTARFSRQIAPDSFDRELVCFTLTKKRGDYFATVEPCG